MYFVLTVVAGYGKPRGWVVNLVFVLVAGKKRSINPLKGLVKMPAYHFICLECERKQTRVFMDKSCVDTAACISCGGKVKRVATGPSSQIMEKLDNGIMVKAVERLHNAEELFEERAKNSDPLAGGVQRTEK